MERISEWSSGRFILDLLEGMQSSGSRLYDRLSSVLVSERFG